MTPLTRTLIVEARHLDTDERTIATLEVEMPSDEAGQRAQLTELVAGLHPRARMRSFGAGAASFLDAEHLVVAHYVRRDASPAHTGPEPHAAAPPELQQALFAA